MPQRPENPSAAGAGQGGHLFAAVSDDRRVGLVVRLARGPGRAMVHIVVLGLDALPLVLVDPDLPSTNDRWEFRTTGLWVELVTEEVGVHWSSGLEAFAIGIDRPDELLDRGYGHRSPLGWELDFVGRPEDTDRLGSGLERQPGRLEGLLLTSPGDGGETSFDGRALRWRWDGTAVGPPLADLRGRQELDGPDGPGDGPQPLGLPAVDGPPIEVALPLFGAGAGGPVWWVGHDGRSLTSRTTGGASGPGR